MEEIVKNKYTKEDIDLLFRDELKNHYIKREISIGNNIQDVKNYQINKVEENIEEDKEDKSTKIKYKIMTKVVLSLFICFCVLGYKYIENPEIKNNELIIWIKSEYKKHYSKKCFYYEIQTIKEHEDGEIEIIEIIDRIDVDNVTYDII